MSRRRGSCPGCDCAAECLIVSDNFERDNADDPGANWNEVDPDWDIDTDLLVERGNANSKIITTASNPRSGRGVVIASIQPVTGSKYRLLVNAKADGSAYQYVEAHCTAGQVVLTAGGETRTYTAADGWDIGIWEAETPSPISLNLYLTDGILYVQLSHLGFVGCVWDNTATVDADPTRRYAGMMNGASIALAIDNFSYSQHFDDNPDCGKVGCYCTYNGSRYYLHWQMILRFYSDPCPGGNNCCCFDGGIANLEYDCATNRWIPVSGTVCGHAMPFDDPPPAPYQGENRPFIECGEDERCDYLMSMFECCVANLPGPDCDLIEPDPSCSRLGADEFVCDPFAVRWNFIVPDGDLVCEHCGGFENGGDYYAILTEN